MSQREAILNHLKRGDTITSLEALTDYGCLRLAAIIFDLREEGFDIQTKMITTSNDKTIAEYSLVQEPVQSELF